MPGLTMASTRPITLDTVNPTLDRGKKRARFDDPETVHRHTFLTSPPPAQRQRTDDGPTSTSSTSLSLGMGGLTKASCRTFIDTAFVERFEGRPDRYNELLTVFRSSLRVPLPSSASPDPVLTPGKRLRPWLESLTHIAASLDRSHVALVDAVLGVPWTTMDEAFVNAYVRFVGTLVSSRGEYVGRVLEKVVPGLKYDVDFGVRPEDDSSATTLSLAPGHDTTRSLHYSRIHHLLRTLLTLIPTLPTPLLTHALRSLPSQWESRDSQVVYLTNLLHLTTYCPQIGADVLGAIVSRIVKIDVEIQVEVEELADEEGELEEEVWGYRGEEAFDRPVGEGESDEEDDEESDEEDGGSEEDFESDEGEFEDDGSPKIAQGERDEQKVARLKELAAKLDAILQAVFTHLQSRESSLTPSTSPTNAFPTLDSQHDLTTRNATFTTLLTIFDATLLRTFKTRYTQFLLFYYTSLSPSFSSRFLDLLLQRAIRSNPIDRNGTDTITRVAAAGYIASFVARATFLGRKAVRGLVRALCAYLAEVLDRGSGAGEEETNLPVFYGTAQAVMYVFCFRWRELLEDGDGEGEGEDGEAEEGMEVDEGHRWMGELHALKRAVASSYNPLKYCSPAVVGQFTRMARKVDFMYCYTVVRSNTRAEQLQQQQAATGKTPAPSRSNSTALLSGVPGSLSMSSSIDDLPAPASMSSSSSGMLLKQALARAQIDSHFPFDPYRLPLSAPFVQDIYRDWDGGGFEESDDEDEDEDEDDGEESLPMTATSAGTARTGTTPPSSVASPVSAVSAVSAVSGGSKPGVIRSETAEVMELGRLAIRSGPGTPVAVESPRSFI